MTHAVRWPAEKETQDSRWATPYVDLMRNGIRAWLAAAIAIGTALAVQGAAPSAGAEVSGAATAQAKDAARLIDSGGGFTCVITTDGTVSGIVRCWGTGSNGRLGTGDVEPRGDSPDELGDALPVVQLGTGASAIAVALGLDHACALLVDRTVKCWGANQSGQLGAGDTIKRGDDPGEMGDALPTVDLGTGRTAKAIAAGQAFTCAILDDDTLKCWGSGSSGRLGTGDTENRGNQAGEMGDALPAIDLGTGRTPVAVTAGEFHACAVLDDGSLKCWGRNEDGQLGYGDTNDRGDQPGEMGDALAAIDLGAGRTAAAVDAGRQHTCAVDDASEVVCWGRGGSLGTGTGDNRGDEVGEMGDALVGADIGTGRTPVAVHTGSFHTCAVLDDANVKCWGFGLYGRLGLGSEGSRGADPGQMGDALAAVDLGTGRTASAVAPGLSHTCAVLDNESVKCWGQNHRGQLALGDTNNRGDDAAEMGDALPAVDGARISVGPVPPAPEVTADAFVSLAPERFVDTRTNATTLDGKSAGDGRRAADAEYRVQIGGRGAVPADATAAVINVTAVNPANTGFVTAHPCAVPRPNTSSLNHTATVNLGNEVVAPLTATGELCLYTAAGTDLTIDVTGYVAADSPTKAIPPGRFFDTRPTGETFDGREQRGGRRAAGSTIAVPIAGRGDVPANAAAVIVNVTAVGADGTGHVTVHPCLPTPPNAASLNHVAGVNRGNELIAHLDAEGKLCIFTSRATDVTADIVGYIPAGTGFTSIEPSRLLDTRTTGQTIDGLNRAEGQRRPDSEVRVQISGRAGVPDGARAVVVNVTAIAPQGTGFVTVHPCGDPRPNTASLNHVDRVNGGNELIARLDATGGLCVFTSAATHLTADVVSYVA